MNIYKKIKMSIHFECKRCHLTFSKKSLLIRHLDKKTKCEPVESTFDLSEEELLKESSIPIQQKEKKEIPEPDFTELDEREKELMCEYCYASFPRRYNKIRHIRESCKKKENQTPFMITNELNGDNGTINNNSTINNNNNSINVSVISEIEKRVSEMVQFDKKYDQSDLSKESFFSLLLQSVYNKTLSKLLENHNNINILPKDNDSSYILINDNVYIIDNSYLAKETSEKLKTFLLTIRNELHEEIKMDSNIYNTISELIIKRSKDDNKDKYMKIYRKKMNDIHIPSVKKILKIESREDIDTVDDIMNYIENLKISVVTDIKNIGNRKMIMKDANNNEHEVTFSKDGVFIFF